MPIKAGRKVSGAPECQRREIKSPRKRACRGSDQVTDQVTDAVLRLVSVIRGQMSRSEIQVLLGLRHLPNLRNAYLKPGIQHGLFEHQRNDFAIHDFAEQRLFTRYEPPVTRYSCDSPSPLHHAVAAQRGGGSPFVKIREISWFTNSLLILTLKP